MSAPIEHVTSADGTTIAFRRIGHGPPVVVLHGALGTSLSWLAVAQRLADRFQFLLVDRRGRGGSDDGTAPHTLDKEVDDARAVLALAGPRTSVIGHSFGGAVALELARTAPPSAIRRLILYEPGVSRVVGYAKVALEGKEGRSVHVSTRLKSWCPRFESGSRHPSTKAAYLSDSPVSGTQGTNHSNRRRKDDARRNAIDEHRRM